MKKPILVVMAAGMGSRYGGLKQMDSVGPDGELIIDFSLYDAWKAGFRKVVFVIKEEMEKEFRAIIEPKVGRKLETAFVFQELSDIPQEFEIPHGRVKPWGTAHAVLSARKEIDAPFAVINADDFYGAQAFESMFSFLQAAQDEEKYQYCMVGYFIENTLTENGHVARGICRADEQGFLKDIVERTKIQRNNGKIQYTENDLDWTDLAEGTLVSMNLWGFTPSMMKELASRFPAFLASAIKENPLKGEYFLPFVVDALLEEGKASVKVLTSPDKWQGVTYKEDKKNVMEALRLLKGKGVYPKSLWV